jgi:CHAT domain-containing protein
MVTVAQPNGPNGLYCPRMVEEVERIDHVGAGAAIIGLVGRDATVKHVLAEMKEAHWAHFACPDSRKADSMMKSGLFLHDGELTLSDIIMVSFPHAEFAFISTNEMAKGDPTLPEESVHLAAGMLVAGYRGVIGTICQWAIRDEEIPQIVENIYRRMFRDGKPNRKEAARALHEVTKGMRESGASLQSWVPLIHIGR